MKRALLNYLISEVDLRWRLWKRHAILVYDPKNIAVRVVAQRAAKLVGIDSDELEKQKQQASQAKNMICRRDFRRLISSRWDGRYSPAWS